MTKKWFYFYNGKDNSIPKDKSIYVESIDGVFRYGDTIIDKEDLSTAITPYDTRRA